MVRSREVLLYVSRPYLAIDISCFMHKHVNMICTCTKNTYKLKSYKIGYNEVVCSYWLDHFSYFE